MKTIYWLLPIIITQLQAVPFILSAFVIFFTPLKHSATTNSLSEVYMFWLFNLLFALPLMVVSSYAYLFVLQRKFCRNRALLSAVIFVGLWCLLHQTIINIAGYSSPFNACIALVIPLFYLLPLVIFANIVNRHIEQQEH